MRCLSLGNFRLTSPERQRRGPAKDPLAGAQGWYWLASRAGRVCNPSVKRSSLRKRRVAGAEALGSGASENLRPPQPPHGSFSMGSGDHPGFRYLSHCHFKIRASPDNWFLNNRLSFDFNALGSSANVDRCDRIDTPINENPIPDTPALSSGCAAGQVPGIRDATASSRSRPPRESQRVRHPGGSSPARR